MATESSANCAPENRSSVEQEETKVTERLVDGRSWADSENSPSNALAGDVRKF